MFINNKIKNTNTSQSIEEKENNNLYIEKVT